MESTPHLQKYISTSRWDRLTDLLKGYVEQGLYPGFATTVVKGGEVVHAWRCGWMDVENQVPLRDDAIYRIYSMTKPITCAALMTIFEEGKFFLDEPIFTYIPAFKDLQVYSGTNERGPVFAPAVRPITFRMLLTHTSGLGYGFLGEPADVFYKEAGLSEWSTLTPNLPLAEMVQRFAHLPLAFQPGERFGYSVANDVIGYLIELLSGKPFADFLSERIFNPLGMSDTSFFVPPEKQARLTSLYQFKEGKLNLIDRPSGVYCDPPQACMGGSGLVSTSADYLRFASMLLNGGALNGSRVLARKTVELMTTNHLAPEMLPWYVFQEFLAWGMGYGLGLSVVLDSALAGKLSSKGTFGWSGAAGTNVFIDPQENLIGILMTQTNVIVSDPLPPHGDLFERLVYQAID